MAGDRDTVGSWTDGGRSESCRADGPDAVREAHLFLTALMSGYHTSPDRRLEIRCLAPPGRRLEGSLPKSSAGSPEARGGAAAGRSGPRCWRPLTPSALQLAAHHAVRWGHNWDVYCGVLPRQGERGGRFDSPELAWLWVDVDGGEEGPGAARDLILSAGIPEPDLAVMSGGGIHAYWRLSEPVELRERSDFDSVKSLLARLVRRIGGAPPGAHADSSRADTASILRIPGTWNRKKRPPRAVRLVQRRMTNPAHSYAWWTAHLPAASLRPSSLPAARPNGGRLAPAPAPTALHGNCGEPIPPWILPWLRQPAPHGSRHKELVRVAAILARDCGLQTILPLLEQKAAISPGPPMEREELEKIAAWALRRIPGESAASRATASQAAAIKSTAIKSTASQNSATQTTGRRTETRETME